MKKTLVTIATLALAAASSQADVLGTLTFKRNGRDWHNVVVNTSSNYGFVSNSGLYMLQGESTDPETGETIHTPVLWGGVLNKEATPTNILSIDQSYNIVANNIAERHHVSVLFKVTNTSDRDMMVSSVDISLLGLTANGDPLPGAGGAAYLYGTSDRTYIGASNGYTNKPIFCRTYFLGEGPDGGYVYNQGWNGIGGEGEGVYLNVATSTGDSGSWDGAVTLTQDSFWTTNGRSDHMVLKAGESGLIAFSWQNVNDTGFTGPVSEDYFVGLKELKVNGYLVPEPATASLSLLGLAALMMRRRRA